MEQDKDLLPWILGALSTVAAAIAITVGSTHRTVTANVQTLSPRTTEALPAVPLPSPSPSPTLIPTSSLQPTPEPEPAMNLPAERWQTAAAPTEPGDHVWECTIDGQKTFSDSPCGDRSSVREIGPINGMDSTPILPHARSYAAEPNYRPEYPYPGEQEESNPSQQGFAGNSYPVLIGIPLREHGRPDHRHRPQGHSDRPPPRRN
jgi:hypothetical protein